MILPDFAVLPRTVTNVEIEKPLMVVVRQAFHLVIGQHVEMPKVECSECYVGRFGMDCVQRSDDPLAIVADANG